MRKVLRSLLCMSVVVIAMCSLSFVSIAYGDSFSNAKTISMNIEYTGTISATNERDIYKFVLNESGTVSINTKSYMEWVYYDLYDAAGETIRSDNPHWNEISKQSNMSYDIYLISGTYYFAAIKDGNRVGNYCFELTFKSSNESFKEGQYRNNNTIASADNITFSKTYNGMLAENDSADFYKFTLSSTGAIRIDSIAKTEWLYCTIYDVKGNELWKINPRWNDNTKQSTNTNILYLNCGTYYIAFSKDGNRTGNYNFKLSFTSSLESFKEIENGINNSFDTADKVVLTKTYKGAICLNDERDIYKFTLSSDMTIEFNLTAKKVKWIYVEIYNSYGNEIVAYNPKWNDATEIITMKEMLTLSKGTYYLSVIRDDYTYEDYRNGNYSFTIGVEPPAITSKITATQSTSAIRLNWNKVSGATGYRVYQYSPSKGKYVHIASVKDTTYRKAKNLKPGTTYKFKIKAYKKLSDGTVIWGTASPAFATATECKAPKITSVTSPSKSKATVKWSNVDGETGFQLYYSTKKTSGYKKINSYSANKLTGSKTFSSSASGKTIYFKVRAYKKVNGQTIFGEWSAVKSVKLK